MKSRVAANRIPPSASSSSMKRSAGSPDDSGGDRRPEEQDDGSVAKGERPLHKNKTYKRQKKTMEWEPAPFEKLNPADPVHAQRIESRRKAVAKGKNTAGYDAYLQQVPKGQRKPRSMDTPSTPDPTLDISTKRWQGLVRAWRVALHKYDPPDLLTNSADSVTTTATKASTTIAAAATPASESSTPAKKPDSGQNLQVAFSTAEKKSSSSSPGVDLEDTTPVSLASPLQETRSPLFGGSRNALDFDDDSDDDLL